MVSSTKGLPQSQQSFANVPSISQDLWHCQGKALMDSVGLDDLRGLFQPKRFCDSDIWRPERLLCLSPVLPSQLSIGIMTPCCQQEQRLVPGQDPAFSHCWAGLQPLLELRVKQRLKIARPTYLSWRHRSCSVGSTTAPLHTEPSQHGQRQHRSSNKELRAAESPDPIGRTSVSNMAATSGACYLQSFRPKISHAVLTGGRNVPLHNNHRK